MMGNYRGRKMVPLSEFSAPADARKTVSGKDVSEGDRRRMKLTGLGNTQREREAMGRVRRDNRGAKPEPFGVRVTSVLDAPAAQVWDLISQFDRGEITHPGCCECTMLHRQDPCRVTPGDVRVLSLKPDGKKVAQRLLAVDEAAMSLSYELAKGPEDDLEGSEPPSSVFPCLVSEYSAQIRVHPVTTNLGQSFLEISGSGLTNSQARANTFLKDVFSRTVALIAKQADRKGSFYT